MKLTLFLLIICMLCSSFLSCSNTTPLDESAATTAATTDSDESTPLQGHSRWKPDPDHRHIRRIVSVRQLFVC